MGYSLITHPKLYDIEYHVIILKSSVGQDFKQDMVITTSFCPTMFRVIAREMCLGVARTPGGRESSPGHLTHMTGAKQWLQRGGPSPSPPYLCNLTLFGKRVFVDTITVKALEMLSSWA